MSYIILTNNAHGGLTAIVNGFNYEPSPPFMEFESREDAEKIAYDYQLCKVFGFRIIEIDL